MYVVSERKPPNNLIIKAIVLDFENEDLVVFSGYS